MVKIRLNKYISNSGYTSRRKADDLIFNNKVKVNGELVYNPAYQVEETDIVMVEGNYLSLEEKVYYMLNKPIGYMSSLSDPNYDKFVVDLIDEDKRIYPVGRLDVDSSGLLLLTNDGEFAHKFMHPSGNIEKVYLVKIENTLSEEDIYTLENGISIDSGSKVTSKIKNVGENQYEITIFEGRNRQVRRMFNALGNSVIDLCRIKMGPLELAKLKTGSYRRLSKEEVKILEDL